MKKLSMILALMLIGILPMMAERVMPETARKVAITFLNNNGAKADQLTDLSKEAGFPNLYIFNGNPGFVVMSADDCVQPILGYSLNGRFDLENMPENKRAWIQSYNDEIQYAIDHQLSATSEVSQQWYDLARGTFSLNRSVVVNPLIQTRWNQSSPYNLLCPGGSVTGCVATAMAQVMKYWNYPEHGIGSHSYIHPNYGELSADFQSTYYDWTHMTNTYNSSSTSTQKTAVATLMYHCGVSVNMNYSPSSSGAGSAIVAEALKNYFNYSSDVVYHDRSEYDDNIWINMLKADLNLNRPVWYCGTGSGGGHAFVFDGYNSDNYFHVNWGWGGYCDEYYIVNNLNPGPGGIGSGSNGIYNDGQGAVFGIHPSDCVADAPLNLTYTQNGRNITLSWSAANGAASYNVYCNGSYVGNATSTTFTHVAPYGSALYYVRSVDANGELSLSSNAVTATVAYSEPLVDDLTASISGDNVTLSWTEPEWCYPETPSATLNYGTGDVYYSWTSVYYAHRHLAENLAQYAGKAVYKVSTFIKYPGTYSIYIYTSTQNNQPKPSSLAFSNTGVSVTITNGWYDFDTDGPIILTGTDDLWVVMKQENTGQTYAVPSFNLLEHNINAFYAGNSPTALYDANSSYNCAWFINTYLTDGTYTYNLYQDGTRIAHELGQTSYNATLNNNAPNLFSVRTNFNGGETDYSNRIGFAKGNASIATLSFADNDQMTVLENGKLTVEGALSNGNAEHLILENGAQLVSNSNGVRATVMKDVTAYTESQNNGWHLIASPFTESITPTVDNGLLSNDYDLYKFDQSGDMNGKEWLNYEDNSHPFTTIENKTGYLYANSGNTTLSFAGTLAASVQPTSLAYDNNAYLKGFNLIGNPYPCNAYVDRSFYVMNEDGSDFTLGSNPIPPCTAILVQAQSSGENVTFSKTALRTDANISIAVAKAHTKDNTVIDKAKVSFNTGDHLAKYTLKENHGKLYIPRNGQDFAVAYFNGEKEVPVNFKATKSDTYTLSFEVENLELNYLHLIDNMTGADVDLLTIPSYTFEAKTTDYASRFKLVFTQNDHDGSSTSSEAFAYISNGEIIINNEGDTTLQIVDMMGRVITTHVGRIQCVPTSGITPGVYVLRFINGETIRTQKIVIE